MAYIVKKGEKPTAESALQNIDVSGWAWTSVEFSKVKLPSSFSFTSQASEHYDDKPFSAYLCPDSWDFFSPIEVKVFTTGRDLTARTVSLTAYPVDTLYGRLNSKLKDYAPQCYYDYTGSAEDTLSGDTEGWSLKEFSLTRKFPVFTLFGLEIVANGNKVVSVTPDDAEVTWNDGSVSFRLDCTASLPDVTVGEVLYAACYSEGIHPVISHLGAPKHFRAQWTMKNINKTPNASFSCVINGASDNAFVRIPPVDRLTSISGEGLYYYYVWFSWDSSVPPSTGLVNYWRGSNIGGTSGGPWGWYAESSSFTDEDGKTTYSVSGIVGGSDGYSRAVAVLDCRELSTSRTSSGRTYRYVHGIPWRADLSFSRLYLYYNARSANPMPSVAPVISKVMVNIGPYPAPWTDEVLDVGEYFEDAPFGLEYYDPLDIPWGGHPDGMSNIKIGDEVHQGAQGVARYGSGLTEPILGWSKEGRSPNVEDIVTVGVNGSAYWDGQLGTIEKALREGGDFPTGLVVANRPDLSKALRLGLRLAMTRQARRVSWTSREKFKTFSPVEGGTGMFTISSAKQSGRNDWNYDGYYYTGLDFMALTTQKLTFLPNEPTVAPVMYIGDPNEVITGGGYSGYFPEVLTQAVLSVDSFYGSSVHATIRDGSSAVYLGSWLNKYGNKMVFLNGAEIHGYQFFEDSADRREFVFQKGGLLDAITSNVTTAFRINRVGLFNVTRRGYATHRASLTGSPSIEYSFSLQDVTRPILIFATSGPSSGGTDDYVVKLNGESLDSDYFVAHRAIICFDTEPLSNETVKERTANSYYLISQNTAGTQTLSVTAQSGEVTLDVMYLTYPSE